MPKARLVSGSLTARTRRPGAAQAAEARTTSVPAAPAISNRSLQEGLQAKLRVSDPGSAAELEADRVADEVMRMPVTVAARSAGEDLHRCPGGCPGEEVLRQPIEEEEEELQPTPLEIGRQPIEEEEEELQATPIEAGRQAVEGEEEVLSTTPLEVGRQPIEEEEEQLQLTGGNAEGALSDARHRQRAVVDPVATAAITRARSGGAALPRSERAFFEPRFGRGFGAVRIHADAEAAALARRVRARAFTIGRDVFFGASEYRPGSTTGRRLLAHELTHVVQQRGAEAVSRPGDGAGVGLQRSSGTLLQRASRPPPSTAPAPPGLGCDVATSSAAGLGLDVVFGSAVGALSTADKQSLSNLAANWHATTTNDPVRIDGFASAEGAASYNWRLSCTRAISVRNELQSPSDGSPGIPSSRIEVFANGETDRFSDALAPNRRVTVHIPAAPPAPPTPPPTPPPATPATARWVAGPVHEVNNLAAAILDGTAVGVTWPMLNGSTFWSTAAVRGLLRSPTLVFSSSAAGGVEAAVGSVPTNTGSFDETVLASGPWRATRPKATVRARFAALAACTGAGNSRFHAMGQPTDAAMFAANRRHEDRHASDHRVAFNGSLVPWHRNLAAAQSAGTTFRGPTQADATTALYAAMGGTPNAIADAFFSACAAAVRVYHGTAAGGTVTSANPRANATCTTSSVESTNPS
jgi:outer membrane protein OmpA-like peptidoglycan-associated protein